MKGSSDSMNKDEVSKRFTHCCAFSSLGERLATFQKKRLMSRRQNKNMMMPPSATPAQLYKKPSRPPCAATFSATMAISGSGGKKDSTIASKMGTRGPSPSKPASSASQYSSVPSWCTQPISAVCILCPIPFCAAVPGRSRAGCIMLSISILYDRTVNRMCIFRHVLCSVTNTTR